jgi:hypothetical protein
MPVFYSGDDRDADSCTSPCRPESIVFVGRAVALSAHGIMGMPSIRGECAGGMMVFYGVLANSYFS